MSLYHTNEFTLELPDALRDKTVNIFSLTDEGPSAFSLVIARDVLSRGENLDRYVLRQRALFAQNLANFEHLPQHDVTLRIDGRRALQSDHTWTTPTGRMYQRQVALLAPTPSEAGDAPHVLVLTATSKDRLDPTWEALFAQALATLRFRR